MKLRGLTLRTAIIAASSTTVVTTSHANEIAEDNQATLLNQITVTATRAEKQLRDVASSVTVINNAQLENQLTQNISDMVRYEPGVSVSSDTRTGLGHFTIRGMDGNRVKLLIDGVNQASDFAVSATYYLQGGRNFVDVETLKSVEIVKGPASSLFGSDAIGGLIAFQTKDPADLLASDGDGDAGGDSRAFSLKSAYSSVNEGFTETFSAANRTGDLESMVIYTRRDTEETASYGGDNGDGHERGEVNPSINRLDNVLAKVQYQLNDQHRIGITGEYQDARSNTDVRDSQITAGVTGKDQKTRSRVGVFHEWDASLTVFNSVRWQLDWQDTETAMETFVPQYSAYIPYDRRQEYSYREKALQLDTQFDKSLVTGSITHAFVYGFHYEQGEASNKSTEYNLNSSTHKSKDYIPVVDEKSWGVFIQNDIAMTERLTVTPGLRYDSYQYDPDKNRATGIRDKTSKDSKVTGRLSAIYDLAPNLSAFAQLSQGFKAPDLIDLYWNYDSGRGYEIRANPDLKPEESNSLELGLRGDSSLGGFEATAFYNKYRNFIETVTTNESGVSVSQGQNIAKAKIQGFELKGQLWLDKVTSAPQGTSLKTSLAYAKGEDAENNTPLNSIAPLSAVIGLGYDAPSTLWGGELLWTVTDEKKTSDINNPDSVYGTSGFGVIDLTAYYKPVEDLTLRTGLFNLTDKKYWHWNDTRTIDPDSENMDRFSQPGRNVSVSAQYIF